MAAAAWAPPPVRPARPVRKLAAGGLWTAGCRAVGLSVAITESQAMVVRGEIEKFRQAAVWAGLHPVESIADAAALPGTEGEVLIAGGWDSP